MTSGFVWCRDDCEKDLAKQKVKYAHWKDKCIVSE